MWRGIVVLVPLIALGQWRCASGGGAECGNGLCETEAGETLLNCAEDCGGCTLDGVCNAQMGETTTSCPGDCRCGNGTCDIGESNVTCPSDCQGQCPNGTCEASESNATCSADCYCGNGSCDSDENQVSCGQDCSSATCPNGTCEVSESNATCSADCYCGNGSCDTDESQTSCSQDCSATTCPDGTCQATETTSSCPDDCYCGNGSCDGGETVTNCSTDCEVQCVDAVCDFWPQCGCDPGQKCTIASGGAHACMAAGTGTIGTICTGEDQCMEGTVCSGSTGGDTSCTQFCNTDADCTQGGGALCLLELGDGVTVYATLCTIDCNPVTSTGCPAGFGCVIYYDDSTTPTRHLTDCQSPMGTSTTTCTDTPDCAPGYFCSTNTCYQYCQYDPPSGSCATGTCTSFTDGAVIGGIEYGGCL